MTTRPRVALGPTVSAGLIGAATLYGVFIGGGWVGLHSSVVRSTTLAVSVVAIAVWAIVALRRPSWRPSSAILPALLIPLAVLAITTATARQPRLGLDYVAWSTILVALYLLLVRLMASPFFRPRILAVGLGIATIVGVWYLATIAGLWVEWWGLVGRIAAPPLRPEFASLSFGSPGGVMAVSLVLTATSVAWIGFGTRPRAVVSLVLIATSLVITILTGARAGWLGLGIGAALTFLVWLVIGRDRAAVGRALQRRPIQVGLVAFVLAGAVVAAVVLPGLLFRAGAGGEGLRLAYYQAALRMFADAPLLGVGPGNWVALRATYTTVPANDYTIPHAHNLYLQVLAESGILGLIAAIIVAVVVGRLVFRAIRSGDRARSAMGWAGLFALLYLGAHQLLDVFADFPAAIVAIAFPIACLDAMDPDRGRTPITLSITARRLAGAVAALALVAAVGFTAWSEQSAALEETAVDALNGGRAADALEPARRAAAMDPSMTPYQVTLGVAASHTNHPDEAATAFARAAAADDLPWSWLGLAAADVELGRQPEARAALQRALRLGVQQPALLIAAADLLDRVGDPKAAHDARISAILLDPRLASDPGLLSNVPPANILAAAANAQVGSAGLVFLALEAGDQGAAVAAATAQQAVAPGPYPDIVAAWYGDRAALDRLIDRARATPLDIDLVVWIGRISVRQDPGSVDRFVTWGNMLNATSGYSSLSVGTTTDGTPSGGAGSGDSFYGHYTYRRPTPWDLTPAGLTTMVSR